MPAEPRHRNSEITRERVLEAARELFAAHGYDAVSVRKVAGQVGISHGTIYLYFRDKDDLLLQVCEDQFSHLLATLRRLPRTRKPAERLADALRALGRFGIANPHEYFLTTGLNAAIAPRQERNNWGPMAEQVGNFMNDLVAETLRDLDRDAALAESLAWIFIASVSGVVAYAYTDCLDAETAMAALDRQVNLLTHGLQNVATLPPPA
jgi:AcrR family transcriptional regulator